MSGDITQLLHRIQDGDGDAPQELFDRIYAELHRTAERLMRSERANHTLEATELVTSVPAFKERNSKSLLKQITEVDPPPPRELQPSVPYDLETIILTAIR